MVLHLIKLSNILKSYELFPTLDIGCQLGQNCCFYPVIHVIQDQVHLLKGMRKLRLSNRYLASSSAIANQYFPVGFTDAIPVYKLRIH